MVEFGEKLKRAREVKGMTQQTLADQLYVTRQAVSRWECGARYPELLTAKQISEILDISLDDLLSGEEVKIAVENQSVIEKPFIKNLLIVLYACISFSYALTIIDILVRLPQIADVESLQSVLVLGLNVTGLCVKMSVFVYGLIMALRGRLTPRKTGFITAVYFAAICLTGGFTNLLTGYAMEKAIVVRFIILVVPNLLGCLAAIQFYGKTGSNVRWYYCLWGISIYGIVSTIAGSVFNFITVNAYMTMENTLNMMLNICILVLILYQSNTTRLKRENIKRE